MSSAASIFIPPRLFAMRRELYQRGEPTPELRDYLRKMNIDHREVAAHAGLLAVCLCKFFGSNEGESVFEFDAEGVPSVVIEALAVDGESALDLIAWPLHDPWQFASAVREADMLGAFNMVQRGGKPLPVWRTPEAWLSAGCAGCVIINQDWGGYWLRKAGGPFLAEDVGHGRELRDMLGAHALRHRILVPHAEARAA